MSDKDFYCLHSDLCKTLANEKRQRILDAIRYGESSVTDIRDATSIPQATVSQHLAILRDKGIVRVRRDGNRAFYSITNPKILQAFDLMTEVLRETLERRNRAVTSGVPEPGQR